MFSPTKPTTFSRLCKNSPVFKLLNSPRILQSLSLSPFCVTSLYTRLIRSYLKQTNHNLLSKHCNLHLQSVTFRRRALFACKQTNIKPLFNFFLILSTRHLDSNTIKPTSLYLKYAPDISISVCLVNIERCSEKILFLYFLYQMN